jgi:hypothetical protein
MDIRIILEREMLVKVHIVEMGSLRTQMDKTNQKSVMMGTMKVMMDVVQLVRRRFVVIVFVSDVLQHTVQVHLDVS